MSEIIMAIVSVLLSESPSYSGWNKKVFTASTANREIPAGAMALSAPMKPSIITVTAMSLLTSNLNRKKPEKK